MEMSSNDGVKNYYYQQNQNSQVQKQNKLGKKYDKLNDYLTSLHGNLEPVQKNFGGIN